MNRQGIIEAIKRSYPDRNFTGFNGFDLVYALGDEVSALVAAQVLWPEFVEIDGMVFLKDAVETEEEIKSIRDKRGSREEIEKSFNTICMAETFSPSSNVSFGVINILSKMIAEMWKCKLSIDFKRRKFVVSIINTDNESDISVVFYQA